MKLKFKIFFCWLLILAGNFPAVTAQESSEIELFESRLVQINTILQELQVKRDVLEQKLQQNEAKIQDLKQNDRLNYLERQKLDGLLKNSQDVARQISEIDQNMSRERQQAEVTGNQLISLYDKEIKHTLQLLENQNTDSGGKKALYQKIEKLRSSKEQVKKQIHSQQSLQIKINRLALSPQDTPRTIRQKADLLKDQEDKLRNLSQQLQKQAKDLQKELELRNRIDDLVTDLALFDQQEETISGVSDANKAFRGAPLSELLDTQAGDLSTVSGSVLTGPKDFDFAGLSDVQIEDAIEQIKKQQSLVESRADSLAQLADKFYKAAETPNK